MIHFAVSMLAQGTKGNGQGNNWIQLVLMLAIFGGIFYFMFIKPQRNQKKKHEEMISKLKAGDQVITVGGIHGTVQTVKKGTVILKTDEKTKIEMSLGSVNRVKGDNAEEDDKEENA